MDGTTPETCSECGFDSRHWRVRDAATLFGALGLWWRLATAGVAAEDLNRRPEPTVWSPLEYGLHTAMVTAVIRGGIKLILDEDGCALRPPSESAGIGGLDAVSLDPEQVLYPERVLYAEQVLDSLEVEGTELAVLAQLPSAAWANVGHLPDTAVQAEAALLHAAHDASHHFMDVARGLAILGAGTPPGAGTVTQVNASDGGVPKLPIAGGRIDWRGLEGDRQEDKKHHGRPFQALCFWSVDVISELIAAGHPIGAGCAGENLTLSGVDWSSLRPGTRMRVGTALVEVSYPAVPCKKQARWFADGDFSRISHDRNPQWARWYAWVREPGQVIVGDRVAVQP